LRTARYYHVPDGQPPLLLASFATQVRVTTPAAFVIVKVSPVVAAVAVTAYPVAEPSAALM
jgi:hypothetical protein